MQVLQSRLFEQRVKKLSKVQKVELNKAVREVLKNPQAGEQKKGDLKSVFVYKFKMGSVLFLLAYRFSSAALELIMLGPHENYYRNLKKYLKNR